MFSQYTRGPRVTGSLSGMRDNTRAGPGLRVRDNTRASYAIPFGYAGQYTRVGYLLGAPRGSLSGSPRGVHEVGVHEVHAVGRDFHAWRVEKARRVDAAWKWRVGMVRRVDAVWIWRVELARRVEMARGIGAPRGRRVEKVPESLSITTQETPSESGRLGITLYAFSIQTQTSAKTFTLNCGSYTF